MKVLLDTNICIYMIKNKPPEEIQFALGNIGISAISVAECTTMLRKNRFTTP